MLTTAKGNQESLFVCTRYTRKLNFLMWMGLALKLSQTKSKRSLPNWEPSSKVFEFVIHSCARAVVASLQLQAQLNSAWVHCCHKWQQVPPGTCQTKQAPRELQWFLLTPLSPHSLSSKNVNSGTHEIGGLQRTAIGRIGEVLSARTCPCTQPYVYALDKLVDPSCAAVCKSVRFRISTKSNQPQKYLAWLLTDTQCV